MSVSNSLTFPKSAESFGIRIRWFVENCCEIRLSNGKTILIDPCLPAEGERMAELGFNCGYTVDDLEGCDYVLINHTHNDHVCSLNRVIERFDPKILINANCTMQLAKVYEIKNMFKIFPLQYGQYYDLGDFRLHTYPAQHIDITDMLKMRKPPKVPFSVSADEDLLNSMGSVFNMNYLIVAPNNFRIGFDGGWHIPSLNDWYDAAPNLLIRHIDSTDMYGYEGAIKHMADSLDRSGAQYMLLNCVQDAYKDGLLDLYEYTSAVNTALAERGCISRVFNFKMGQWYTISTNINLL